MRRDDAEEKERVLLQEEKKAAAEGSVTPRAHAGLRLELAGLKDAKNDLEAKLVRLEVRYYE